MTIDKNAKYSKSHEWVREEGDLLVFGISDYAQEKVVGDLCALHDALGGLLGSCGIFRVA